ncbi:MAG: hypothetical protein ACKO96_46325, partial [Flammeovirgaceae bacterium]
MINISKYLTNLITNATRKALPAGDFTAQVTWSQVGTSDLTSPSAMKLYNMNKNKWNFPSSKEIAQEIITQIEKNDLIKSIEIVTQITAQQNQPEVSPSTEETKVKTDMEEETKGKGKKDSKNVAKERAPQVASYFMNFILHENWVESISMKVLREGINIG